MWVAEGRTPVIFVPGICGSTLKYRDRYVWGDLMTLVRDFGYITVPGTPLQPTEVLKEVRLFSRHVSGVYGPFLDYLQHDLKYTIGQDLFPFAYDWRLDCRYSAFKLEVFIHEMRKKLQDQSAKFVIIAHSMGGLVARYCVQKRSLADSVSAIIAAGTPHHGSADALRTLLRGASVFPLALRRRASIRAVRSFPSTYQLLPFEKGYLIDNARRPLPVDDKTLWHWLTPAQQDLLFQGYEFHRELAVSPSIVPVYSVCGYGQNTLGSVGVQRRVRQHVTSYSWRHPRYLDHVQDKGGDGVTLYDSARYDGKYVYDVHTLHGRLLDDIGVREYIGAILKSGAPAAERRSTRRSPYLDVRFMARSSVYTVGDEATLFIGLRDERDMIVRGARFHLDLHGPVGTFKTHSLGDFQEAGTKEAGQIILVRFHVPRELGEYHVRVTLSHADGIVLAPAFQDEYFKVYPPVASGREERAHDH